MRYLLTSAGVTNASIRARLVELLGKSVEEASALCIPTAMYGHPAVGPGELAWRFISGQQPENPMTDLGWASVGLLELTALPSIARERWVPLVERADALLVSGGDALYLAHWLQASGLAAMLPGLAHTVWVGMSAGSMVMTPRIGREFVGWQAPDGSDAALGAVSFSIFPHLDNPTLPSNTLATAERWAAGLTTDAYAVDDATAISVVDGAAQVISEGKWVYLPR